MHPVGREREFIEPCSFSLMCKRLQHGRRAMLMLPINDIRTVKNLVGKMALLDCSY